MNLYEKKYKEALETVQEILSSGADLIRIKRLKLRLQSVFPELKESDDEGIRREIIEFLRLPHPQFVGKRDHEKWIAWLEKQGEKKPNSQMEKCSKCQFVYTGYCNGTCILKNNEQKPVDKVEPKFKVRDWIVDDFGNYWRVVKVRPNYYELEGDDGVKSIPIRKYVDEKYHLWTIDDAKKGDILVVDGIWIVEFDKKMTGGYLWKDASILTSFEYDMDDDICTTGSHVFYKEIWPASKEDIDLFKKKRNEYLASNSHNESKFKVGDKVTIEGDDTIYTIHSINLESCWLTHLGRGRGWAKLDSLKHYVE